MDRRAERVDVAVIGAGAAGLFAALHAAREAPERRVLALDGARTLGAKILVAGGGRCNVTHHVVSERDYHGSTAPAIRNVLRQYGVAETVALFRELGVELKREATGKLFPTTDSARTVLDALLSGARAAGAEIRHPWRVAALNSGESGFTLRSADGGFVKAERVVLAAGGRSLPKSGSDGAGERLARSMGLAVTERVFPALVPLTLPGDHPLCALSGVAFDARLTVFAATGKKLAETTGAVLCTHFGLSGPGILDVSRCLLNARADDPGASLSIAALPHAPGEVDRRLLALGRRSPMLMLRDKGLPERLAETLCRLAGVDPHVPGAQMKRDERRALVAALTELVAPAQDPRGWN